MTDSSTQPASSSFPVSRRNRVRRVPKRGAYDAETIYAIVDAAIYCHVGLVDGEGQPFVIPTLHARDGDRLLLHGATTSRLIQHVQAGQPVCITVTQVDGIVLARSVFHHSMNYRSAVVFGRGHLIEDDIQKMAALERFTEKLVPGRWQDARQPNQVEMKATSVVAVPIESGSAKIRTGDPSDDAEDMDLDVWAGVIPLHHRTGDPVAAADLKPGLSIPRYVTDYVERGRS